MAFIQILVILIFSYALAQANTKVGEGWIHQQNRSFIEDRIQYWGTGKDLVEELALFKAKGMAIKSISEECGGFYSKDIVIRRQKIEKEEGYFRAYVHADIPYVSCNYSKTPMAKSDPNLENKAIVGSQKLYDSLIQDQYSQRGHESDVLRADILKHIKQTNQVNQKKISTLEDRIKNLESRPSKTNQTIIQNHYQLSPSESSYQLCMEEYQELMDDAKYAARKSRIPGNLAEGRAARIYMKSQKKLEKCRKMKK